MKIADVLSSRVSFIVLQVLDLATTLIAFHYGAFEVEPAGVAPYKNIWSDRRRPVQQGVRCSNHFSGAKAHVGRQPVYVGVVCWNTIGILGFASSCIADTLGD